MIPTSIWILIVIVGALLVMWYSSDIGSWWEERKQAQFDKKDAEYEQQIEALKKNEAELIRRAEEAEAREQAQIIEADLLRQEAAKRGVNVEEAQKKIDAATTEYQKDQEFMAKVATGEVSKFDLCQKQCKDSAEQGYPCRANYCEPFK